MKKKYKSAQKRIKRFAYCVVDFLLPKLIPVGLVLSAWAILSIEIHWIPTIISNLSESTVAGLNKIFLALSYSFIAGVIVYWFTVKFPFEFNKKVFLPVIEAKIIGLGNHLSNMNLEFRNNNANPDVSDIEGVMALFSSKRWTEKCRMPEHVKCKNITDAFFQDYIAFQNKIDQLINDYKNYLTKQQLLLLELLRGGRINMFVSSYEGTNYTEAFYEKILQPEYKNLLVTYNQLKSTLLLKEKK